MQTKSNSEQSTLNKHRYRQISVLLLNHIKLNHKNILKQNSNFRILLNKRTQNSLQNLKKDFEAKQLTLQYFSSFQLISDLLTSKIDVECLADIQELCNYLSN
ncbi:unnamed protein product [Paramecium primaurelia]|uniref:Uncharacterized protein n=1 Tax=Paramecium primaurelia TaxID=5886 RepID=A0A8S1PRQ5_PARPR|nr:unnamed protein product [Paramecium primaurelia]